MEITLAFVISADGRITHHDESGTTAWASEEDQQHFHGLIADHPVLVMGRGTYGVGKKSAQLSPDKLRIVMTSHPEQHVDEAVEGQREFVNETPTQLIERLKAKGIEKVLVVGGTKVATEFLQEKLINHIYLTVEPKLFGDGKLLTDSAMDVELELLESKRLNDRGTLLLHYKVI